MMKQSIRSVSKKDFENVIKKAGCNSAEDVSKLLYSKFNGFGYDSDYVLKYKYANIPKKTFINRLNTLWVYPIFILLIPIRYLAYGEYKINEDSNLGKIVLHLIGEFN